jgi:hypothetical protein
MASVSQSERLDGRARLTMRSRGVTLTALVVLAAFVGLGAPRRRLLAGSILAERVKV